LKNTDRVLEAGSGYSTLWLARRCAEVVSLEGSEKWKQEVERKAKHSQLDNIKVEGGNTIEMFKRGFSHNPDVVVIDHPGDRVSVFQHILGSPSAHQPRMIIYDNSDRPGDRAAFGLPYGARYEAFSFRGFGPQTLHVWETTVFVSRQPGGAPAIE
jgi:predicted O-methyltransferase YrrM